VFDSNDFVNREMKCLILMILLIEIYSFLF